MSLWFSTPRSFAADDRWRCWAMEVEMPEHVRVTLTYIHDPKERYMFDVAVDERRRIVGKWKCFGLCEEEREFYPVVLSSDGELDFGFFAEDNRFAKTNLRDRPLEAGGLITITDSDGDEQIYRIQQTSILGKGPI